MLYEKVAVAGSRDTKDMSQIPQGDTCQDRGTQDSQPTPQQKKRSKKAKSSRYKLSCISPNLLCCPTASLEVWDRLSTIQKWVKLRLRWARIVFGVSLRKREDRCLT